MLETPARTLLGPPSSVGTLAGTPAGTPFNRWNLPLLALKPPSSEVLEGVPLGFQHF